jgi:hypothetical protein
MVDIGRMAGAVQIPWTPTKPMASRLSNIIGRAARRSPREPHHPVPNDSRDHSCESSHACVGNRYFNHSTGGEGETDARSPWREGGDREIVEAPHLERGVKNPEPSDAQVKSTKKQPSQKGIRDAKDSLRSKTAPLAFTDLAKGEGSLGSSPSR